MIFKFLPGGNELSDYHSIKKLSFSQKLSFSIGGRFTEVMVILQKNRWTRRTAGLEASAGGRYLRYFDDLSTPTG
jgi:hypothetical protein